MIAPPLTRSTAAVALVMLLAGACSSDDDASSPAQTTADEVTTTTVTASTTTPTSTTSEAPAEPLLPGLDPSIGAMVIDAEIMLADGSAVAASFDGYQAGPTDGELVLLLHGFPQAAYEWRDQLAELGAAGYHAVAVDQRGYSPGARPVDDADYATSLLAADVVAFADALGAATFHVVGHDWGGAVAWVVAGLAADRVETLTVLSTPHPAAYAAALENAAGDQSAKVGYIATLVAPGAAARFTADGGAAFLGAAGGAGTPDDLAAYVDVLGTEEAMSAALAWYRAASETTGDSESISFSDSSPAITVPTLYVWSDGDCCLGRDAAEATAGFVEGPYRFEILEGVSHWVPEEAASEVNALLLDHFAAFDD